ncbi:MAG: hypothetical protein ACK4F4_16705 [Hylemonella sp.]|jgi:hypothetical protein|uniref:hypothetical protein n=1 Tax=Hylemonella sp. TaxID=2066020 RepID=UPI00391A44D7
MKLILGLVSVLAAASVLAQLPPPPRAAERVHTNYEAQVPKEAKGGDKVAPGASNAELADLLRKQTAAIQALHGKVSDLEARVLKLERGAR